MTKVSSTVVLTVIFTILLIVSFFYLNNKPTDLVYVDVNKLVDGYNKTEVLRKEAQGKNSVLSSNLDSLVNSWKMDLSKYEKERSSMTAKELDLKKQLLSSKQKTLNDYKLAADLQIEENLNEITKKVIGDVNLYLKQYGEANGHPIIFGASGNGSIMYANDKTNITNDVLEGLNKQYKK